MAQKGPKWRYKPSFGPRYINFFFCILMFFTDNTTTATTITPTITTVAPDHCSSRPPQQQQRGNSSKRGLLTAVTKDGAQDVCASQAPVKFFSLFFSSSNIYLQKMVLQFQHHQCHRSIQRWWWGLGLETCCLEPQVNFSFFYNNTTGLKTHTSWAPGTFFFSLFPSTNIYIQKRVTQLQPAPPVPPP